MKAVAATLLLLSAPAFAASFDGVWQAAPDSRFTIHGEYVHHLVEQDGRFAEERSCSFGIERKVRSAYIYFMECWSDDGALIQISDRYLLTRKGKDTLRVRIEKRNGRLGGDDEWTRVE